MADDDGGERNTLMILRVRVVVVAARNDGDEVAATAGPLGTSSRG